MPRGKRNARSLATLERELHDLNARRHAVVEEIKSLVEQLSFNVAPAIARLGQAAGLGADLPTKSPVAKRSRKLSAATRAKMQAAAKARWAAAKKAGKTKL